MNQWRSPERGGRYSREVARDPLSQSVSQTAPGGRTSVRSSISALLVSLRLDQRIKNFIVLFSLIFGERLGDIGAFRIFCELSGAMYASERSERGSTASCNTVYFSNRHDGTSKSYCDTAA